MTIPKSVLDQAAQDALVVSESLYSEQYDQDDKRTPELQERVDRYHAFSRSPVVAAFYPDELADLVFSVTLNTAGKTGCIFYELPSPGIMFETTTRTVWARFDLVKREIRVSTKVEGGGYEAYPTAGLAGARISALLDFDKGSIDRVYESKCFECKGRPVWRYSPYEKGHISMLCDAHMTRSRTDDYEWEPIYESNVDRWERDFSRDMFWKARFDDLSSEDLSKAQAILVQAAAGDQPHTKPLMYLAERLEQVIANQSRKLEFWEQDLEFDDGVDDGNG